MRLVTLAVALLLSASSAAQSADQSAVQTGVRPPERRLTDERGQLLVWRIVATSPSRPFTPTSLIPVVHSQTAGGFGQTSSTFGQTAGSTGQTASSLGQTAGSTGQTAGSTGQTAGSFGQTSSTFGQTAGSTGQTAGSLGESLDTLASAAERSNGSAVAVKPDTEWQRFTQGARSEFRALDIVYEDVGADELEARLRKRSPDVLVGTPLPSSWSNQDSGLVRRYGLVTLAAAAPVPQEETPDSSTGSFKVEASILRAAHNPSGARDFVLWLYRKDPCSDCNRTPAVGQTPVSLAKSALFDTLNGLPLGPIADREAAPFNASLAQQTALSVSAPALLVGLNISIEATGVAANARFAAIALRAVVENSQAFGIVHAVVVLRTDNAAKWHVLQITPNLQFDQQLFAWGTLRSFGANVAPEDVAKVLGVVQAAPTNGDNREPSPDFWWDNRGGATLEVVEWQRKAADNWTGSNLFFVSDDIGHLRTRVTGRFADSPGPYLWRIWSIGRGGIVVISPWRSLNIVPH